MRRPDQRTEFVVRTSRYTPTDAAEFLAEIHRAAPHDLERHARRFASLLRLNALDARAAAVIRAELNERRQQLERAA